MSTQQQEQRPDLPQRHRSKRLSWMHWLIASVILLFIIVGIIIWILTSRNAFTAILPIVIFTVLGVLIALFQWLFPISSSTSEHPSAHQHALQVPPQDAPVVHQVQPVVVHVPTTLSLTSPSSLAGKASYRGIVGLPPPTDPRTIQQREQVVREVYTKLIQQDITDITLTGIGGVGKSTLAALIYRYTEEQRRTDTSPFQAETLWLTIDPAVTFADLAGNLFEALGKPLLDLSNLAPQNQAVALFNALNTTDKPRLVILDQFENLLDWDTGHALTDRPGVGEWLDILNSQQCQCRILLTSRPRPVGTREYPPTYLQEYPVAGLEVSEGVALLRNQGVQGSETELRNAVTHCAGHAFSLTLLATLMRDHHMSLATLFKNTTLWTGDIATNLLDQIYTRRLTDVQRELLLAFSVYREPITLEAVETVITRTAKGEVSSALKVLRTQHLLEAVGEGRYQLHSIITDYAQTHFDGSSEQAKKDALRAAHARAAQYYLERAAKNCPLREQRRKIGDVHDLIETIWQLCQAGKWREAYDLIVQEEILADLNRWGGNAILQELYELLLPLDKWQSDPLREASIYNDLGEIYRVLGQLERARECLERASRIYKEAEDRKEEGRILNNLGRVYYDLGNKERAREYYQQALNLYREEEDRRGEGRVLNNLGRVSESLAQEEQAREHFELASKLLREIGDLGEEGWTLYSLGRVYDVLGPREKALKYFENALDIHREVGDRGGEGWTLIALGRVYGRLRQFERARRCHEEALSIHREIGDLRGEGWTFNNLGKINLELGEPEQAQEYFGKALSIFREVGDRWGEGWTLNNLGTAYTSLGDKEHALDYYEQALVLRNLVGDHRGWGRTLKNLGRLYSKFGNMEKATPFLVQALGLSKQLGDREGEAEALYNMSVLYFSKSQYNVALAFLLLARNNLKDLQNTTFVEIQKSIDTLRNTIGDEQFIVLLSQVEQQAQQIVDRALGEIKQFSG